MCSFRAKFATVAFVGLFVMLARNSHGIEKIIKHILQLTSQIFEIYNNRKKTSCDQLTGDCASGWLTLLHLPEAASSGESAIRT
jgi:hypothetical protein